MELGDTSIFMVSGTVLDLAGGIRNLFSLKEMVYCRR